MYKFIIVAATFPILALTQPPVKAGASGGEGSVSIFSQYGAPSFSSGSSGGFGYLLKKEFRGDGQSSYSQGYRGQSTEGGFTHGTGGYGRSIGCGGSLGHGSATGGAISNLYWPFIAMSSIDHFSSPTQGLPDSSYGAADFSVFPQYNSPNFGSAKHIGYFQSLLSGAHTNGFFTQNQPSLLFGVSLAGPSGTYEIPSAGASKSRATPSTLYGAPLARPSSSYSASSVGPTFSYASSSLGNSNPYEATSVGPPTSYGLPRIVPSASHGAALIGRSYETPVTKALSLYVAPSHTYGYSSSYGAPLDQPSVLYSAPSVEPSTSYGPPTAGHPISYRPHPVGSSWSYGSQPGVSLTQYGPSSSNHH